jgi:hypothetical protein
MRPRILGNRVGVIANGSAQPTWHRSATVGRPRFTDDNRAELSSILVSKFKTEALQAWRHE